MQRFWSKCYSYRPFEAEVLIKMLQLQTVWSRVFFIKMLPTVTDLMKQVLIKCYLHLQTLWSRGFDQMLLTVTDIVKQRFWSNVTYSYRHCEAEVLIKHYRSYEAEVLVKMLPAPVVQWLQSRAVILLVAWGFSALTGSYPELAVLWAQWEGWDHRADLYPLYTGVSEDVVLIAWLTPQMLQFQGLVNTEW